MMPGNSPCKGCPERFTACSDKCPKDARGEYGYKAWKADCYKIKAAEKEYNKLRREEYMRSEQREFDQEQFIHSKNGRKRGYIYGR